MLKHRNFISFFSTILIYLGIGILFFYLQHTYIGTEQKPQEKIISFALSEYEPEVIPPVEEEVLPEEPEVIEPEPIPEPIKEEIKEEEPRVEEEKAEPIVEKVISKPVVKKVIKKKIVKKKKPKKKIKKVVKKKVKKRVHKKVVSKKTRKKPKVASKSKSTPAKKNRFLNQLRGKINRYKTYPRIAQRRGMQGSVKVRFTILANGHVGNITVSGKKVFYNSARNAVKKAFPINIKKASFSLPTTVNVTLRYQLR